MLATAGRSGARSNAGTAGESGSFTLRVMRLVPPEEARQRPARTQGAPALDALQELFQVKDVLVFVALFLFQAGYILTVFFKLGLVPGEFDPGVRAQFVHGLFEVLPLRFQQFYLVL